MGPGRARTGRAPPTWVQNACEAQKEENTGCYIGKTLHVQSSCQEGVAGLGCLTLLSCWRGSRTPRPPDPQAYGPPGLRHGPCQRALTGAAIPRPWTKPSCA